MESPNYNAGVYKLQTYMDLCFAALKNDRNNIKETQPNNLFDLNAPNASLDLANSYFEESSYESFKKRYQGIVPIEFEPTAMMVYENSKQRLVDEAYLYRDIQYTEGWIEGNSEEIVRTMGGITDQYLFAIVKIYHTIESYRYETNDNSDEVVAAHLDLDDLLASGFQDESMFLNPESFVIEYGKKVIDVLVSRGRITPLSEEDPGNLTSQQEAIKIAARFGLNIVVPDLSNAPGINKKNALYAPLLLPSYYRNLPEQLRDEIYMNPFVRLAARAGRRSAIYQAVQDDLRMARALFRLP